MGRPGGSVTGRGFDVDDHDRFERPRRHTRPRTKERPTYADARAARVIGVDRGRYTCLLGAGETPVTAMRARALGRRSVVVGDRVRLVGDTSGGVDSLARIVEVEPRATVLRRTADDKDPAERVIVANADQLVVVVALADPAPRPRLIDRCLVAAYDAGLHPLLCLTKADLAVPDTLVGMYEPLGVAHVVTWREADLTPLVDALRNRASVLVGHSGVGKSTLVNRLVPGSGRTTAGVSAVTGRGRHTSSSAVAVPLPGGGWLVDTPGLRSFGLAHVRPGDLIATFPDLRAVVVDCPRGCRHTADEPECALDEAVRTGAVRADRVDSWRRLWHSRERPEAG